MHTPPTPTGYDHAKLQRAIARAMGSGWVLQNSTPTTALLVRPAFQANYGLHIMLTLFTCGLWGFVLAMVAIVSFFDQVSSQPRQLILTAYEDGTVWGANDKGEQGRWDV